jgi:hypothetical protein
MAANVDSSHSSVDFCRSTIVAGLALDVIGWWQARSRPADFPFTIGMHRVWHWRLSHNQEVLLLPLETEIMYIQPSDIRYEQLIVKNVFQLVRV